MLTEVCILGFVGLMLTIHLIFKKIKETKISKIQKLISKIEQQLISLNNNYHVCLVASRKRYSFYNLLDRLICLKKDFNENKELILEKFNFFKESLENIDENLKNLSKTWKET